MLYIHGYDPRDPSVYRKLASFELRRFARLWDVTVDVDREEIADALTTSLRWKARMTAGDAVVDVTYETLRWDDFVKRDFATPLPMKILRGLRTALETIFSGFLFRVARASIWSAAAWLYPIVTLGAVIAAMAWLCVLIQKLGAHFGAPVLGGAAGLAVAAGLILGALEFLRRSGSFIVHLMDDGAVLGRYAARSDAALEARVDVFAARIADVVLNGDADEVLVVGHSSGSFVAIDAVARAYETHEGLGRGAPLALLTVGANELLIAFHSSADWFRERIRRLAVEKTLFWAEVVGRWDTLNFPHRDPVAELKLDTPADRPNPTFRQTYLSKMLTEETIREFRKGFRVFRTHFQFVLANEIRGPYDYFSLVCGPWTARSQFARTADGRLMSPHLGLAPKPLPRPDWLPPLPDPNAPKRSVFGRRVRP